MVWEGSLDLFCGSEFWNTTLSWNTDNPDLTICFERTVLIWIPCVFLWVFSPLEVYYLIHSKNRNVPWNLLNETKLFLTLVLSILCLSDFGVAYSRNEGYSVYYYTPFILLITYLLSGVLVIHNRSRGMVTSGTLFFFWLLLGICGAFQFRTYLIQDTISRDSYYFISYMVYYPLVLLMLFLNCWADKPPLHTEHPNVKNPCPETRASELSKLVYAWFENLAWLGYKRPLEAKDLWSMNPEDTSREVVPKFDKYWNKSVRKNEKVPENTRASFRKRSGSVEFVKRKKPTTGASILPALCKAFGPTFLFGAFLKLLTDSLTFVNPHILELLIELITSDDNIWKGYFFAVLMFLAAMVQTIILSQYFQRMFLVGLRIRTALISAIYRKALRMSNSARKESTVGEIVNLMSVDAQRFMDLVTYLNMIWSAPFQIAVAMYFLWMLLGPSVLAGLAVMIILIPVNGYIAAKSKALQIKQMKNKDERVKLMNEILSGIKVLKLYAWEQSFEEQVLRIRNKEINVLKQAAYLNAGSSFIWSCAPFLVSLATFAVYVLVSPDNILTPSKAFVSLSYFNIMRFPMSMLPMMINFLVQMTMASLMAFVFLNKVNTLNVVTAFVPTAYFNVLKNPMRQVPRAISVLVQMTMSSLMTFVLLNNVNKLNVVTVFVTAAYFNVLKHPLKLLPMAISSLIQVSLMTFATYVLSDPENNVLDTKTAFVSLSLFNILRFPLSMLPMMVSNLVQTAVSVKRINKFMNSEELDPTGVSHDETDAHPLSIQNGTFSWGAKEEPTLHDINLHVGQGQLVAVVGTVGAGKSSLVSALLGEMDKISGRVNTKGSIAYVSQQAWIQNATLRDNILFGRGLDLSVYNRVVDSCALKPDLEMLPGGDQTEIGEKGINLSGGQKQRVNLARAVYSNADVYFLDDPLSAVDAHVGKHIFENVIGPTGILRKKTRLLVTHGITYLPEVDCIIVLSNGRVTESGSYKELLSKKGAFAEFLVQHLSETNDPIDNLEEIKTQLQNTIGAETMMKIQRQQSEISERSSDRRSSSTSLQRDRSGSRDSTGKDKAVNGVAKPPAATKDKLIEVEKSETGSVKWAVYSHYLKSIGIGLSLATIIMNIIYQAFSVGSNFWLSKWTSDPRNSTQVRDMYLGVYGGLGFGQALVNMIGSIVFAYGSVLASQYLHLSILDNVLRNGMDFFDTTPIGRIVNRFGKDIDVVDNVLPMTFRSWIVCFFSVIGTLVVISSATPMFIAVILPISVVYYFVQRFYVATSRQLKRIESVSRSPIYSHFGESITGATTIRAYSVQKRFIQESEDKVDFNQVCYFPSIIANRWLAVRLETVGNLIIFFAALFAVIYKDVINAGLVGLSITYSLQITQTLNWLVRMTSEVETNIVAVERIKEYGETPQEAAWDNPDYKPPQEWPVNGEVEFSDYQVRYREGLDLVLKGISFKVNGGEKVGIVGRTGAGKSSLTLGLFRIIEAAGGKIIIDGVDVSKLGLHALRSRLTIIPQDPVLFSGNLRMNLDPFNTHSDSEVWTALEHAHLKNFVSGLPAGLLHEVSEGGENLSVGQRQLVCLARALLRKTKVLILDEATAAVDLETDDLIQRTIRTEFKDCTVLTIAHRLNTIMDSDRVLVLDKGTVVEYDSPQALLANTDSIFCSMARDAGIEKKK